MQSAFEVGVGWLIAVPLSHLALGNADRYTNVDFELHARKKRGQGLSRGKINRLLALLSAIEDESSTYCLGRLFTH